MSQIFNAGDMLSERFRIKREVGRGGMGVVLCAEDVQLKREVAIKLLLPDREQSLDVELVERFLREARTVAAMESPHIVRLFHTDQLPDGAPYIVMEMLRGEDLQSVVARLGRLQVDEAVWYLLQACKGLAEAHRRGIIHRDLKPANLFLDRRSSGPPQLKILDFGIAKVTLASAMATSFKVTAEGKVLGTPLYMSPEQRDGSAVDVHTDIWALGVLLYELVTGSQPFPSENMWQLEYAVRTSDPRPLSNHLPGAPEGFEQVLLKCLAKAPRDRYQNVAELALALAPFGPREAADLARSVADGLGLDDAPMAQTASDAPAIHNTMLQWKTTMQSSSDPDPSAVVNGAAPARSPDGSDSFDSSDIALAAPVTATPMSSDALETPPAQRRRNRRMGLYGIGVLLGLILAPILYFGSQPQPFSARLQVRAGSDGSCPSLPSTAKLVADWGAGSRSVFLDADCNASFDDLPPDQLGVAVAMTLSGGGDWMLAEDGVAELGESIALVLVPTAVEPPPEPEAPEVELRQKVHVLSVGLRAPGKVACPKDVQAGELRVLDRVVPVGLDCRVQLELPPEVLHSRVGFSLSARCHRLVDGNPRVDSDTLELALEVKPGCRPKPAARCAKPCKCWDEKNNPCRCLYACAKDCSKSESLCAGRGARR